METHDDQSNSPSDDKRYESVLRDIYYTPSHPASFAGAEKLYEYAWKVYPGVTLDQVKEWLSGQITYTLHKQARRVWTRNRVEVDGFHEQWQVDLTFLEDFISENNGFKYVLTAIDILSKYAFARPLKTKTAREVMQAFKEIFKVYTPKKIQSDKGTEFNNDLIKKFFKKNDIIYFTTHSPEVKCCVVERFNRTLKGKMFKIFTANGNHIWYDKLDDIMHAYNNSKHRSTKFKPAEVTFANQHHVWDNLYGPRESLAQRYAAKTLQPGDPVRKKYILKPFERGFYPNWTDEIDYIDYNITGDKPRYKLKNNKDTKRRFYPEEVQKIKEDYFRVEKILKRRKTAGKLEYFVKWLGYDDKHNSWIPATAALPITDLQQLAP